MNDTIEEIKKRIDIVDFLSSYISLKKTGRNFKANCPFHQEKTPSFVVSPERQIWHCFGSCNEGGDIIKFLMKWENITFFEAVRDLAEKAGVKLKQVGFEDGVWKKKERLVNMNLWAVDYFHYILTKTDLGKKALDYLKSRSINKEIAETFKLGYAPSSWDSLLKFLKKKKFTEPELYEGGLITRGQRGNYFDMFRGRLMFPIKDARGNIIAFSGRSLDEKDKSSKYINTPETPIYHKRETLFGIDLAKDSIKKEKNVYLVEGEFDVISPYQHGVENVVATKGTAVTREQLMLLKRYTDRITLTLDSDSAGEDAVRKAIDEGESVDCDIEVVAFDWAKDPDEAVRQDTVQFKKTIKKTTPAYDFILELLNKKYPDNTPFDKKKIGEEMVPYIEKIRNPIVQSHYIKKLAELLGVSESSIEFAIRKLKNREKQKVFKVSSKKADEESREVMLQKYLLSLILQNSNAYKIAEAVFKIIAPSDFSIPALSKVTEQFLTYKEKFKVFNLKSFFDFLPNELHPVLDELYLYASVDIGFEDGNFEKLAHEVRKFSLKRDISQMLSTEIQKSGRDKLNNLSADLKEVEKKLSSL